MEPSTENAKTRTETSTVPYGEINYVTKLGRLILLLLEVKVLVHFIPLLVTTQAMYV